MDALGSVWHSALSSDARKHVLVLKNILCEQDGWAAMPFLFLSQFTLRALWPARAYGDSDRRVGV